MIAAGFGCRSGCALDDLVRALTQALAASGARLSDVHALYAPEFKRAEPGLALLAEQLGRPLVLLTRAALEREAPHALTSSAHVRERHGLPSIAETAALAGAVLLVGPRPADDARCVRLLGPRTNAGGATCALASGERT